MQAKDQQIALGLNLYASQLSHTSTCSTLRPSSASPSEFFSSICSESHVRQGGIYAVHSGMCARRASLQSERHSHMLLLQSILVQIKISLHAIQQQQRLASREPPTARRLQLFWKKLVQSMTFMRSTSARTNRSQSGKLRASHVSFASSIGRVALPTARHEH